LVTYLARARASCPSCVTTYPPGSSSRVFVIRLPSRSLGEGWCFYNVVTM